MLCEVAQYCCTRITKTKLKLNETENCIFNNYIKTKFKSSNNYKSIKTKHKK